MNIQVQPVISGIAIPRLFEVGHFVRIRGTEDVGRVVEDDGDDENNGPYSVCVFGEASRDESFSSGHLEIWTPQARPAAVPLDNEKLQSQFLKILGAFELIEDIAKQALANGGDERFNHVELVATTFADMTCEILDDLSKYEAASTSFVVDTSDGLGS